MADKQEVIDYLRNKQKEIEIKSKSSGINLWVLMAAIAAVGWAAIASYSEVYENKLSAIAWSLVIFQAVHYAFLFSSSLSRDPAEIRYFSIKASPYPILSLLLSLWLFLPPIFLLFAVGIKLQFFLLVFISSLSLSMQIHSIIKLLAGERRKNRFPAPNFFVPPRIELVLSLVFSASFLYCAIDGFVELRRIPGWEVGLVKFCVLISALYLMIIFAIEKKIDNGAISWTYELEASLVLGLITADVAARKIEHRSLGVRLAQVMDDFYDEMDKKISDIEKEISRISAAAEDISKIPVEYMTERRARWLETVDPLLSMVKAASDEMSGLVDYLGKLKDQPMNPRLKEAVELHSVRGKEYVHRLSQMSSFLREKTDEIIPKPIAPG